ncbi:MAG: D-cysteine desulfhydrase family protein [Chloroflexi bacterium]|nr:D-cysteine desulfhydrase family protein [Chloroflexota bacterium]
MNVPSLRARLGRFPRIPLGACPTPLEPLERLSAPAQTALWIKRDDCIGPAMGGNKARKLEFLMADAQQRRARKVVTFGGLQSNHARLTAAVARNLGMEPHLFYFEPRPRELAGNLLLASMLDAKMHFVPLGRGGGMTLEATNRLVRLLAWLFVGRAYFIPVGGHTALGCLGYVAAAAEIHSQVEQRELRNVTVVTAMGTGGTLAGLLAGFTLLHSPIRVLGIDVGKLWKGCPASIAHVAGEVCALLGEPQTFAPADVPLIEECYVGPGYGIPSPEGNAALRQIAQCAGVFLDPIYTGKAMAGLLDLVAEGNLEGDVIFLHTGGIPGLFAFPQIITHPT